RPRNGSAGSSSSCARSSPRKAAASAFATAPRRTSRSTWCERDEQSAVLVVGGEEVGRDVLTLPGARTQLELLAEPSHTPFERDLGRVLLRRETVEPEAIDQVGAQQLLLAVAHELEDASTRREDPSLLVADDEPGVRRRVVVVHQLEQEAEPAALARDGNVVDLLQPVVIDGALLAVRADEVGHPLKVATGNCLRRSIRPLSKGVR